MSELQKAADELISLLDSLDLDVSDAVKDDVSTIAILAGGKLSPGQLADDDMQWVLSHLLGDITEALDTQDDDVLEQTDPLLVAMVEELEKAVGTVTNEDLKDKIEDILASDEGDEDEDEDEG